MKNTLLVSSLIVVVALATACKPSTATPATQTTAAKELDKVQAATTSAAMEMKDFTFAQRTEFVVKMRAQVAELNASIEEVSLRIAASSDAVKEKSASKLAALRAQSAALDKQLDAITSATQSTWSRVKADSEKAYAALKDGVNQSRQWVSDVIAP